MSTTPLGQAVRPAADRAARRRPLRLPAAPRPRPSDPAERGQCARQHLCAESRRLHRRRRHLGGRVAARGACRRGSSWWSTSSSTAPWRGRTASSGPAWSRTSRWPIRPATRLSGLCAAAAEAAGASVTQRRHLSRDGRPAILLARRKPDVSAVGLRRHRHDRHARSQARPRGRASLRLVGMVTDYDCWRGAGEQVEVAAVIAQLMANADSGRQAGGRTCPLATRRPRAVADRHGARCRADHRARCARSERWSTKLGLHAGADARAVSRRGGRCAPG